MARREKERTKVEPKAKPRQKEKTKATIRKVAKAAKASHQVFRAKERAERLQTSLAMYAVKLDTLQRTAGMVECAMWHQVWLQVRHHQTGPILQACHNRDKHSNKNAQQTPVAPQQPANQSSSQYRVARVSENFTVSRRRRSRSVRF